MLSNSKQIVKLAGVIRVFGADLEQLFMRSLPSFRRSLSHSESIKVVIRGIYSNHVRQGDTTLTAFSDRTSVL
jgi:hypothetical protein